MTCLPRSLILYAIEGLSFAPGEGLSPAVECAVGDVVDELRGACADGGYSSQWCPTCAAAREV